EIAARYRAALEPTRFVSYRTPYSLSLEKTGKLPGEPALIQYENAVRRLDSLFAGLDGAYPKAALGLWRLSESPSNPRHLRARDALFAGLLSARAGWQASAGNLFAASALGGIDREERYLRILWAELDSLSGTSHVDRVVARVNAHRVA